MSNIQVTARAIPARTRTGGFVSRDSKYNLAALNAGTDDCIVLDEVDADKAHSRLASAVAQFRKKHGKECKFAIRKFTETVDGVERTLVGVWRTK